MFPYDPKNRQRGTGFTNIQRILGANVGAGQQMAGSIAGGITSAGQQAMGKLGEAEQKFQTGFQKAVSPIAGTAASAASLARGPGESVEDYSKRLASSGVDYAKIGQMVKQMQYTGPKGYEGVGGLLGSAIGASKLGGFTGSEAGQRLLLNQFVGGRQGYTKGQSALDQMLLGQSGEAQRQLQQARQSISGIPSEVLRSTEAASRLASGMQQGIEEQKSELEKNIQTSIGELQETGKRAAEQYSKEASRLSELFSSDDGSKKIGKIMTDQGTVFDPRQAEIDKKLLKNLQKYGIDTSALGSEGLTRGEISDVFKEIASRANTGITQRYEDPERIALQKLAQFQQDTGLTNQLAQQKNQSAFQLGKEDIQNLAAVKTAQETRKTEQESFNKAKNLLGLGKVAAKDIPKKYTDPKRAERLSKFANDFNMAMQAIDKQIGGRTGVFNDMKADQQNKMFTELGKKYGFSDQEINDFSSKFGTKGEVKDWLFTEAYASKIISKYAQNEIDRQQNKQSSLQDYINRTYGLS